MRASSSVAVRSLTAGAQLVQGPKDLSRRGLLKTASSAYPGVLVAPVSVGYENWTT